MIPEKIKKAIDAHTANGTPTGGFVHAVLCNNLSLAIGKADEECFLNIRSIIEYVYWEIPGDAWGSVEKVDKWKAKKLYEKARETHVAEQVVEG